MSRVVVSGVGVVAPNGIGKEAYWQALLGGLSGVHSIRRFDSTSLDCRLGGEVKDLRPEDFFAPHELKRVDRSNILAVAATELALRDAALDLTQENGEQIGSAIGNAICGIEYAQNESDVMYGRGPRWGSPYLAIAFFPCGSNGLISIRYRMKGPVLTLCNGNTSGTDAIGMAYRLLKAGRAQIMVAGGTEAPLIPLLVGSMAQDRWLSRRNETPQEASRPFDAQADGMVLSEGSAMLVLETEEHARARGARIYAEISGYSSVNSAYDVFRPEPNGFGIERTMLETLEQAGHRPEDVDWVNCQGFSIPEFDAMESRCIRDVFGLAQPYASAISATIGNPVGALGALQAAASVLAIHQGQRPPHPVYIDAAAHSGIRWVSPAQSQADIQVVMQNSFCFMGKNSSLLFQKGSL